MSTADVTLTPDDAVPTLDQEKPVGTYKDWEPERTRVIVYTTDPEQYPKDRVAVDGVDAQTKCEAEFGQVLEVKMVPYRYFFRVRRV